MLAIPYAGRTVSAAPLSPSRSAPTVAALATIALVAFASNSLLCRLALAEGRIDAASFTAVRITSGALMLVVLVALRRGTGAARAGSWGSALALFLYAAPFSFAYLSLGAGVGALILFGAVQLTMVGYGVRRGERPPARVWLGLVVAFGGLIALAAPGASAPAPTGAALMAVAGVAWGLYSVRGRGAVDPLAATAGNFVRCVPLALAVAAVGLLRGASVTASGLVLAAISGAVTSGGGYALWYAVLPALTMTRAAVVQLLVPIGAAAGGVLVLGEPVTARLIGAGAVVVGGVALALRARARAR